MQRVRDQWAHWMREGGVRRSAAAVKIHDEGLAAKSCDDVAGVKGQSVVIAFSCLIRPAQAAESAGALRPAVRRRGDQGETLVGGSERVFESMHSRQQIGPKIPGVWVSWVNPNRCVETLEGFP